MRLEVSRLDRFPLKTAQAEQLFRVHAQVDERGLDGDHRWCLVDMTSKEPQVVTQRAFPQMAQVTPDLTDGLLTFSIERRKPIAVSSRSQNGIRFSFKTQIDVCEGIEIDPEVSRDFSEFLCRDVKFVALPGDFKRPVDPDYDSLGNAYTGYNDGFPILVVSRGHLNHLNNNLRDLGLPTIGINRARGQVEFTDGEGDEEDQLQIYRWRRIRVGNIILDLPKPSKRCVIFTTDQLSGDRINKDPLLPKLNELYSFPDIHGRIIHGVFGMNAIVRQTGDIAMGDKVEVLEWAA